MMHSMMRKKFRPNSITPFRQGKVRSDPHPPSGERFPTLPRPSSSHKAFALREPWEVTNRLFM